MREHACNLPVIIGYVNALGRQQRFGLQDEKSRLILTRATGFISLLPQLQFTRIINRPRVYELPSTCKNSEPFFTRVTDELKKEYNLRLQCQGRIVREENDRDKFRILTQFC